MTGKEKGLHSFSKGGEDLNVLSLSRELPDIRAGLNGSGSESEVVARTRAIKLSSKRVAEWEGTAAANGGKNGGGGAM